MFFSVVDGRVMQQLVSDHQIAGGPNVTGHLSQTMSMSRSPHRRAAPLHMVSRPAKSERGAAHVHAVWLGVPSLTT